MEHTETLRRSIAQAYSCGLPILYGTYRRCQGTLNGPLRYGQSARSLTVWTVYGQRGNLSQETCISQSYSCGLLIFYGTYRNSQGTLNGPLRYGQSARSLAVYGHSGLPLAVWAVYGQRGNLSQETCISQSYSCGLLILYVQNIQKLSGDF